MDNNQGIQQPEDAEDTSVLSWKAHYSITYSIMYAHLILLLTCSSLSRTFSEPFSHGVDAVLTAKLSWTIDAYSDFAMY